MNHSFDTEVAAKFGMEAAVIYQSIQFWVARNKANSRHEIDGKHWCYNSRSAWKELFPYLTDRKIRTAIQRLVDGGLIEVGNHSGGRYSRTTWYSLVENDVSLVKTTKAIGQNDQSITDIKPTDIINNNIPPIVPHDWDLEAFELWWEAYSKRVGKGKARQAYMKALKTTDSATLLRAAEAYAQDREGEDPKYTKHPATWLNQECWADERERPDGKRLYSIDGGTPVLLSPDLAQSFRQTSLVAEVS